MTQALFAPGIGKKRPARPTRFRLRSARTRLAADRRALPAALATVLLALLAGCAEPDPRAGGGEASVTGGESPEPEPGESVEVPARDPRSQAESGPLFTEVTDAVGLDFHHFNGMSGELYFDEMVGPGVAPIDYDGDGDLDLFFVQGDMLGDKSFEQATMAPRHPVPLSHRLYRNESSAGALRFTDVTDESGLAAIGVGGYGMGVAVGDVDNDGRADLYVTAAGANQLLLSRAGSTSEETGTFEEITDRVGAGLDERRWSVSATFFDFDLDGWLDLYVGNYVAYSTGTHKQCVAATGAADYCGPHSYPSQTDRLFRNLGTAADGLPRFADITSRVGLDRVSGAGLGVVALDFDLDGWLDLYVANDGSANHLWRNLGGQGELGFEEQALFAGTAFNRDGHAEAGMGVVAADIDNDGDEDLFLSHLTQETNTLYRNLGGGQFDDVTQTADLGAASWNATGFGTGVADFDLDGHLDLVVANGAVKVIEALQRARDPYPLHQPNQLFHNRGDGTFVERHESLTEVSEVSRGLSIADLDNDGDPDLVIANNSGRARLYLSNAIPPESARAADRRARPHWLGLHVLDRRGHLASGAWVTLERAGAPALYRRVGTGGGYASAHDPRVLFGLGTGTPGELAVVVRWPGNDTSDPAASTERFAVPGPDRYLTLKEGSGAAID